MKLKLLIMSLFALSFTVGATQYPTLTETTPEKVGFNTTRLEQMEHWINQQVTAGYPSIIQ